jgi:hypothetical protein
MKVSEYLDAVLSSQKLKDDSGELEELRSNRESVEALLRKHFSKCSPTIRYGGSQAKGSLIRESYDLDIICYFPAGESGAGESLKDIYGNVRDALSGNYFVESKTSALRLKSKEPKGTAPRDFHIDVIPGRYTDSSKTDCFIYQASGEKERLKTNLDVHIEYVKDSGVLDAIRLIKLWKVRRGLNLKHFVLELMIIKLLVEKLTTSLAGQLESVWKELRDRKEPVGIEDPANPQGNDLSAFLSEAWPSLKAAANDTLNLIETSGWDPVFGQVEEPGEQEKVQKLRAAAAAVITPTKPWCPGA